MGTVCQGSFRNIVVNPVVRGRGKEVGAGKLSVGLCHAPENVPSVPRFRRPQVPSVPRFLMFPPGSRSKIELHLFVLAGEFLFNSLYDDEKHKGLHEHDRKPKPYAEVLKIGQSILDESPYRNNVYRKAGG
jgi:hypothetical protein